MNKKASQSISYNLFITVMLVLITLSLTLTACAEQMKAVVTTEPTALPTPEPTRFTALIFGELVAKNECLRIVETTTNRSYLIAWPPEFSIQTQQDRIIITKENSEEITLRIGEEIRLGGGEVNSRAVLDESVQKALPEQCPGPYWVASLEVGPVMTAQDSTTTPVRTQKLRITNQSTFSIQNLVVRFPEDRVEFGDVLPGETTDFRVVPFGVYRYAAYDFEVEGQEYQQPVVDWVGESPMNGMAFTYILDVDPSTWDTEGQVIWLVDVIGGQDNITPSLTPSVRMREKEAIDKAIALATSNQPEINATGANLTNIKAQQSTIADAFQEILSTSTLPPGYTPTDPVWIVTMDGEWSAGFPLPTHISTPEAYRHFYVILDAKSGSGISLGTYRSFATSFEKSNFRFCTGGMFYGLNKVPNIGKAFEHQCTS